MKIILNIAGTDYDGGPSGRPAARIFDLSLRLSVEDEWSLEFSVLPCGANAPFAPGLPVTLTTTEDDGSDPQIRFAGDVGRPEVRDSEHGYLWGYCATDLKHRATYVTLIGLDGSGTASFNLSPDDPLNLYALNGRTVGNIVKTVLESPHNATTLDSLGVGAYASLSPPTLPAQTLADLALLDVVPRSPVQLQGMGILNRLEEFVLQWHPQFCCWVEPTGVVRFANVFGFSPRTLTVPTDPDHGDPIDWPEYAGPDCTGCFTAVEIRGLDIRTATLSLRDGTLSKAWTNAEQASWTLLDFLQPRGAVDEGTLSAITSSSATVHSDHAPVHWPTNFWNDPDVQGWIQLIDLAGTGIELFDIRQITHCSALAAGGSATVGWDAALPLTSTGYTRYRIVGLGTKKSLVDREFHTREPATGKVDLETWVGSRLVPRNPKGFPVANNSRVFPVFYPYAFLQWSRTGAWPWWEIPVNVQIRPDIGRIVFTEPPVLKSAGLAGAVSVLNYRYPTGYAEGLYYDLKAFLPFNAGDLVARAPDFDASGMPFDPGGIDPEGYLPPGWDPSGGSGPSGWSGTAKTKYGIERLRRIPLDSWNWFGDQPDLVHLAEQFLECYHNAVIEGGTVYHGIPTAFDPFQLPYALKFVTPGQETPLDGEELPVRSAVIRLTSGGADIHTVTFAFSNLKRPFSGDTLYTHPAFGINTFGMQGDEVMVVGEGGGMMDMHDFNEQSMQAGATRRAAMPQTALSHESVGQAPVGQAPVGRAPMGMTPAGQDAGQNPIAASLAGQQGTPDFGGFDASQFAGPIGGRGAGGDSRKFRGPSFLGPQETQEAVREQAARDKEAAKPAPAYPQSIMNMRPDPDKVGFGPPIEPDNPYPKSIANPAKVRPPAGKPIDPDAPSAYTPPDTPPPPPQPPRTTLRQRRGLEDDDTTIGGG